MQALYLIRWLRDQNLVRFQVISCPMPAAARKKSSKVSLQVHLCWDDCRRASRSINPNYPEFPSKTMIVGLRLRRLRGTIDVNSDERAVRSAIYIGVGLEFVDTVQ